MTEPMPMPPPEKAAELTTKPTKSKGEKFFDRAVYGGIAGVGTFVLTVPLTYLMKYGAWKNGYKWAAEQVEKPLLRFLSSEKAAHYAEQAVMTTTLMMGGNVMLLPIGLAEHAKIPIVEGLNTALNDPTPKEAIQEAPKQTWMSLAKSRAVAWVWVFSAFTGASILFERTFATFADETGTRVHQLLKGAKTPIDKKSRAYLSGTIGAVDFFATIAAATLLYMGGHFFARKQEEKKERREERKFEAKIAKTGHTDMRNASQELQAETPASNVTGEKQREGSVRELATTPQL